MTKSMTIIKTTVLSTLTVLVVKLGSMVVRQSKMQTAALLMARIHLMLSITANVIKVYTNNNRLLLRHTRHVAVVGSHIAAVVDSMPVVEAVLVVGDSPLQRHTTNPSGRTMGH